MKWLPILALCAQAYAQSGLDLVNCGVPPVAPVGVEGQPTCVCFANRKCSYQWISPPTASPARSSVIDPSILLRNTAVPAVDPLYIQGQVESIRRQQLENERLRLEIQKSQPAAPISTGNSETKLSPPLGPHEGLSWTESTKDRTCTGIIEAFLCSSIKVSQSSGPDPLGHFTVYSIAISAVIQPHFQNGVEVETVQKDLVDKPRTVDFEIVLETSDGAPETHYKKGVTLEERGPSGQSARFASTTIYLLDKGARNILGIDILSKSSSGETVFRYEFR